jgi:hypothetical protein
MHLCTRKLSEASRVNKASAAELGDAGLTADVLAGAMVGSTVAFLSAGTDLFTLDNSLSTDERFGEVSGFSDSTLTRMPFFCGQKLLKGVTTINKNRFCFICKIQIIHPHW